jgi:hypothetical protein
VFDYSEFSQDMAKVFNTALFEEVIINNRDGNSYKLLPMKAAGKSGKSPLEDIPRIKLNVTTKEIVEILHECRAGI